MDNDHAEGVVAALQLLMGDQTADMKRSLIYKAFGSELIVMLPAEKQNLFDLAGRMNAARNDLIEVTKMCDGASPLGLMAQRSIHNHLTNVGTTMLKVQRALGWKS